MERKVQRSPVMSLPQTPSSGFEPGSGAAPPAALSSEPESIAPTRVRVTAGQTLPSLHVDVVEAATASGFRPSPAMLALGGEIVEWSPPQRVRVRYPIAEAWKSDVGALSVGFLAAMFEPPMSAIVGVAAPHRSHAVLETSSRFFRQLREGHVVIDATLVRAGSTTVTVECVAWDDRGELCSKGAATFLLVG